MTRTRQEASASWLSAVPLAILVAAGALSIVCQLWIFPSDVQQQEWRRCAEVVRESSRPDSGILVHPDWTEKPLPYLSKVQDRLIRAPEPSFTDLARYETIWIMTPTDRRSEALNRLPFNPAPEDVSTELESAHLQVLKLTKSNSPEFSRSLLERLESATVARVKEDGESETCRNWDSEERRWDCGSRDRWLFVGQERLYIDRAPRRCIWAHPVPDQKILEIRFESVRLRDELWIEHGFSLEAARRDRGSDVVMSVTIDGEQKAQQRVPPRESTWRRQKIDTRPWADTTHDVTVQIEAESIYDRFFCFNGWMVSHPS